MTLRNIKKKTKFNKQEKLPKINYSINNKHRFHFFFSFPFYFLSFSTVSGHCSYVCVQLVGFSPC